MTGKPSELGSLEFFDILVIMFRLDVDRDTARKLYDAGFMQLVESAANMGIPIDRAFKYAHIIILSNENNA